MITIYGITIRYANSSGPTHQDDIIRVLDMVVDMEKT